MAPVEPPALPSQSPSSQRPTMMRRKSSAQNLLLTLKSSNQISGNVPIPLPAVPVQPSSSSTGLTMQIPPRAYNSGMGMSTLPGSVGASAATPVTTTSSMNREWDAQSMHSDSVASSALNGSPAIGQGTSIETLRDVVMKRMITLTYMRNVHEGYGNYLSFQRIN